MTSMLVSNGVCVFALGERVTVARNGHGQSSPSREAEIELESRRLQT